MEGLPCNWPECEYVATTDNWTNNLRAMECHKRGKHGLKMSVVQANVEEGGDAQVKKRTEKRAQAKLPMFEEVETREEFKRKSTSSSPTPPGHSSSQRSRLRTFTQLCQHP